MNSLTINNKSIAMIALIGLFQSPLLHADALDLETVPLFTTKSALSNLILVTDDSGSMDGEVLFPSNDGALWWNTANNSYVDSGAVNANPAGIADATWKKFVYLFPNGTGTGERVYGDNDNDNVVVEHAHFAIPPLDQFGFAS
ncbi:MAG: hypothetical protein KAI17_01140, partial [Thiotrichaceae bacterium]|nr:hypothetical protein [Thiotrichaceae bacterium]